MENKFQKIITPIGQFFYNFITQPELYLQFIFALFLIVIAKFADIYIKRRIQPLLPAATRAKVFSPLLSSLYFPLFSIIFLSLGIGLCKALFHSSDIISGIVKLAWVWVIVKTVYSFSENKYFTRIVGIIVLSIALLSITSLLEPITKFLDSIAFSLNNSRISILAVLKFLVALTVVGWITAIVLKQGKKQIKKSKLDYNTRELMVKGYEIAIYFIAFLVILNTLGIDLTAFAVLGGALGVGIGFGLQKITANFISGIILLLGKSVRVGDIIELDGTSIMGTVKSLGIRNTLIEGFDAKEIFIPNEELINGRITNWTYSNTRGRIDFTVGISYKSDVRKAMSLVLDVINKNPRISKSPDEPACYLKEFADSAINLFVVAWVDDINDRLRIKSEIMLAVWDAFVKNGIEIPYPQRDVHIRQAS